MIWDYQTGFEVDGSAAVVGDRVYFGGEDKSFYCLSLADGKLIYKIPDVGSDEGSVTYKDGRVYLGTEGFYLFCFNADDGKIIWKSLIGADSDSTPAVANGMVYTAAEDGVVRAYNQTDGKLVWQYTTEGGHYGRGSESIGIWASPIFYNGKIYIGASDGYLHCLERRQGRIDLALQGPRADLGHVTGRRWARGVWRQGRLHPRDIG